jgi:uncharacterized membrane protein YbaN (DUF454 family)
VGLGALGAILPGLPTTIFLLGASWCFARSCPWLEERLLNSRFFRPFRVWLRPDVEISPRARGTSMAVMWIAIGISAALLVRAEPSRPVVAGVIVALGFVGTWFIATHGRRRSVGGRPGLGCADRAVDLGPEGREGGG